MGTVEKPENKQSKPEGLTGMAAANLGINLVAGMAVLSYLGYRVDVHRGGGQAWTLAGMALGLVYGAYETWKVIRTMNRDNGKKPGPL